MIPTSLSTPDQHPYASRGGLKLEAALHAFQLDPDGLACADLGCSTGGFVSCLLHHGAKRVFAVDTAYGELAWDLRNDPRVVVCERTNALHAKPPAQAAENGIDLVSIDLGWTRQDKALPAAMRWLGLAPSKRDRWIVTLIKPHYERPRDTAPRRKGEPRQPALTDDQSRQIAQDVLARIQADARLGLEPVRHIDSPIHGGKGGNLEVLALLRPRG
ncbi:MAG: SAM-dependent methyltransferase [Planctomycetota bacterium]